MCSALGPVAWIVGGVLLLIGLYQSATAPDDYQQGATVKIMFIHVPNAWLSISIKIPIAHRIKPCPIASSRSCASWVLERRLVKLPGCCL